VEVLQLQDVYPRQSAELVDLPRVEVAGGAKWQLR